MGPVNITFMLFYKDRPFKGTVLFLKEGLGSTVSQSQRALLWCSINTNRDQICIWDI